MNNRLQNRGQSLTTQYKTAAAGRLYERHLNLNDVHATGPGM